MAQLTAKLLITIIIITYRGSKSVLGGSSFRNIIEGQYYYWGVCSKFAFNTKPLEDFQIYRSEHDDTMNCKKNEWIIDWNAEDLGKTANKKNCTPAPPYDQEDDCSRCLCVREPSKIDCTDVNGFYWQKGESNIDENKVLIGFYTYEFIDYLKLWTKHATLLSNGEVKDDGSWEEPTDYSSPDVDCYHYSNNLRTFYLDDVILPAKYVVTGIKLVAMEKSAGPKGWKLQVKGTEYDSSFKLIKGTDQWFDYSNNSNSDVAYKRNRTEIDVIKDADTNHYLRRKIPKFLSEETPNVQTHYHNESHETEDNLPLQGVRLSYRKYYDHIDFVMVKAIPHRSLIHTPTTPPVETVTEITTKTTTEVPTTISVKTTTEVPTTISVKTTTEVPTTISVKTTTEAPITTSVETTVAPKIISSIKLRTTTTTTTTIKATRYMMFNISTQLPPTIQPKLKRLRTHPVNVSCKSEFKVESGQEENVDLLEELFIPDEKGENSGTEFSNSQLSFICPLLLSIFFIVMQF